MIVMLFLPALARPAMVPWDAEQYTATANNDVQYGPPLPINASFSY